MKFNKIRPLLIFAFVAGSFPLQSADHVPAPKGEGSPNATALHYAASDAKKITLINAARSSIVKGVIKDAGSPNATRLR